MRVIFILVSLGAFFSVFDLMAMRSSLQIAHAIEKDEKGNTALHYACLEDRLEDALELIGLGADLGAPNCEGKTPEDLGLQNLEDSKIVRFLNRNKTNSQGYTLLHFACLRGDLNTVRDLVNNLYADVNIANEEGYRPLHIAASKLQPEALEIVKILILAGADVNALTNSHNTALHESFPESPIRNFLLICGVDLEIKNKEGMDYLEWDEYQRDLD